MSTMATCMRKTMRNYYDHQLQNQERINMLILYPKGLTRFLARCLTTVLSCQVANGRSLHLPELFSETHQSLFLTNPPLQLMLRLNMRYLKKCKNYNQIRQSLLF